MKLSGKLYKLVEGKDVISHDRDCYLWIWYFLLAHEPKNSLKEELVSIENAIDNQNFSPQNTLELAWKAEAIELMLGAQ
jgi:hypothetical protein